MKLFWRKRALALWQLAFLLSSMSWLLAPSLNHALSPRLTLISEYETAGQPFALLFRSADVLAGALLIAAATWWLRRPKPRLLQILVLIIGVGLVIDPIAITDCVVTAGQCHEPVTASSVIHGLETLITGGGFLLLAAYDSWRRRRWPSLSILSMQVIYITLFAMQLDDRLGISTIAQNIYQAALFIWIAWLVASYAHRAKQWLPVRGLSVIRSMAAGWAFINGVLAIILSLSDLHLLGYIMPLYFGDHTAWLAQHGVIVGVVLLYVSRHVLRGEARARLLLLALMAVQTARYSLVSPSLPLTLLYFLTFVALFISAREFQRGSAPVTRQVRLQDLRYILGGLAVTVIIGILILNRSSHVAAITRRSLLHYYGYVATAAQDHRQSALLAHTLTAFIAAVLGVILWALFRPIRPSASAAPDYARLTNLLARYSSSSEDYFKLWPTDKQYFEAHGGFIAYRLSGGVVFALADPIAARAQRPALLQAFLTWADQHSLSVCFLAITESQLPLYGTLKQLQIGSSALISTSRFVEQTSRNKWWRWKLNRAAKQGYVYERSTPPHSSTLLSQTRAVSNAWLSAGGHDERGFALGYYDNDYLQRCDLHYLQDDDGQLVAFVNQLPSFTVTATIDLLRFIPGAQDAMPFLLAQVIASLHADGTMLFDLGFVPFAGTSGPLLRSLQSLGAGRFSAKGLQQFKGKFEPDWQPIYTAYSGDVGDMAKLALNLEKVLQAPPQKTTDAPG